MVREDNGTAVEKCGFLSLKMLSPKCDFFLIQSPTFSKIDLFENFNYGTDMFPNIYLLSWEYIINSHISEKLINFTHFPLI